MAEDFLTLEEASAELGLGADALKQLVGEGEIRAFRDAGSMKFRRSDVDAFRSARAASASEAEMPTEGVGGPATEELVFEEPASSEEPGMVTEEIQIEEEAPARPKPRGSRSRTRPGAKGRGAAGTRTARGRSRAAVPAAEAEVESEEPTEPAWVQGLLIVTLLVMLVGAAFSYSAPRARQTGLTQSVSDLFLGR